MERLEIASIPFEKPSMPMIDGGPLGRILRLGAAVSCIVAAALCGPALAQSLMPPGSDALAPTAQAPGSPGTSLISPNGPQASPPAPAAPAPPSPAAPLMQAAPMVPTVPVGQVALVVSARYGRDPPAIASGLIWRIYTDKPDPSGQYRLLKEDRNAAPVFLLPPGEYIVHATFGLAGAAKRVQLRAETVREVFEIAAGGARFEGRVGDARIPNAQISFDVFKGSQFDPGEKHPLVERVTSGDVVLLPEGTYHVVSNYGDGNSVMRSDFRVQAAKLTEATIVHRAAKITLKLVSDKGGEALANTQWSVLTPGGDVIKETTGAFPVVILAEGDYVVVAKNEGKVFNREFKVEAGFDREIEVLSR
jgi:hypothetical protein